MRVKDERDSVVRGPDEIYEVDLGGEDVIMTEGRI
jgi:hypothetical protein